jgi:protein scribble
VFTNKIGALQVGLRLLEVNGISLLGVSHQEAVNVLRNSGNEIMLVVCKGERPLTLLNRQSRNFISYH